MRVPRFTSAPAAVGLAAALALGCASGGAKLDSPASQPLRGSWLFRAEIQGREGGGSVRLTLRRHDAGSFELAAADALGQTRWRLFATGGDALWLDVARQRFCRLGVEDGIPAGELRSVLRLGDLPDLLLGDLPRAAEMSLPDSGTAELLDAAGRSYRGERAGGRWASWTLRDGGRPVLWYRKAAGGAGESMLSGREPAFVLRWRESARGDLPDAAGVELVPPPGFTEESCVDAAAA